MIIPTAELEQRIFIQYKNLKSLDIVVPSSDYQALCNAWRDDYEADKVILSDGTVLILNEIMCFTTVNDNLTAKYFGLPEEREIKCRGCGTPLLLINASLADGCACNSERGINHGIVPTDVCTCERTTTHAPKILVSVSENDIFYRVATISECEKLSGLPVGYTKSVSPRQSLKAIGNGWHVAIVSKIFEDLKT